MQKVLSKILACSLLLCAPITMLSCNQQPEVHPDDTFTIDELHIHRFVELNRANEVKDSHADSVEESILVPDYSQSYAVSSETLNAESPFYARLRLVGDTYFLFYNDDKNGPSVLYSTSKDLVNWTEPITLLAGGNGIRYANPEAVVAANGDLLVFAAYRNIGYYNVSTKGGGIMMCRSTDGGQTFEKGERIYLGTNWEPYPCLDPDTGELVLYFTNTTSYALSEGGYNTSTGTAVIRSLDNGYTWTGSTSVSMQNEIVAQQATEVIDGIQYYTDQMPVAVRLNNGNTLLALESRLNREGNYHITIAHSSDNWATTLSPDEEGPADKETNIYEGTGPYCRQFISGETLLSFTKGEENYRLNFYLGDSDGRNFRHAYKSGHRGTWAGLELVGTHTVAAVMSCPTGDDDREVRIFMLHLNHSINAKNETIRVNGNNTDWTGDEAIFLGTKSNASASIRAAHDDENVYFLVERIDSNITDIDSMALRIAGEGENYLLVEMGSEGATAVETCTGSRTVAELELDQVNCKVSVKGTVDGEENDTGILYELAVPKTLIEGLGNEIQLYPVLTNKDSAAALVTESYEGAQRSERSTWAKVFLSPAESAE